MAALPLLLLIFLLTISTYCSASVQRYKITPGFQCSQMTVIDNNGLFLLSNSSNFAFGFTSYTQDGASFVLAIVHQLSRRIVWTANRDSPISHSDNFVFDTSGNIYLESSTWSTNTTGKGATVLELHDSGNLVLLGSDNSAPLWQSFSYPTDTLLSGQNFEEGMSLISEPNSNNLTYRLGINSDDLRLYADYPSRQPYWSMRQETRAVANKLNGEIYSATILASSWNIYDRNDSLNWQFILPDSTAANATWAAVLGNDGFISFFSLSSGEGASSSDKIPADSCSTPEPCDPYNLCYPDNHCQCPSVLSSEPNCNPGIGNPCDAGTDFEIAKVGDGIGYFATGYVSPNVKANLTVCIDACSDNCSCVALFYDNDSSNCFLFDQIGSLQSLSRNTTSIAAYIKVPGNRDGGLSDESTSKKHLLFAITISISTAIVIVVVVYFAVRRIHWTKRTPDVSQGSSEEDNFLEISGMPVRYSYRELEVATDNFSVKLGQGGFGSVYLGKLPDGSQVAVKKLEGVGQGKKEFRSEVTIIGSIHHIHLVKLRGFCAEGTHRLLAYEYMAKGSLDRWLFNEDGKEELDWDKRYNIALGTAKGLAYLHEDCESKIVHCDIKPENVLLDENFHAKVSDFGLAKLMTREQSHVFTTLRGTRGYLAPEWITNYAISEKSDVYSFGMVLLEIIGGRKNYDPKESSEKAHFPSYAFKKMEEGNTKEIFDVNFGFREQEDKRIETIVKVALWCIQEDLHLRPSMVKVVQMLEGLHDVQQPPTSSQIGFRLYANVFKSTSDEGTSSGPSDCNSDAFLSAVRLSGPR